MKRDSSGAWITFNVWSTILITIFNNQYVIPVYNVVVAYLICFFKFSNIVGLFSFVSPE